jgi:hypothetical protein
MVKIPVPQHLIQAVQKYAASRRHDADKGDLEREKKHGTKKQPMHPDEAYASADNYDFNRSQRMPLEKLCGTSDANRKNEGNVQSAYD